MALCCGSDSNPSSGSPPAPNAARRRLRVRGIVQGVGFRPYVFRLAGQMHLAGFVGNDSRGVFIEVEGVPAALDAFGRELAVHPPPLAHVEEVEIEEVAATGEVGFRIVDSEERSGERTLLSPDLCLCEACLAELLDPNDRRYRYPFINCTDCGPRFTIIRDVPYDRPFTTMAGFEMCAACRAEYENPASRRFHAQPNACPRCGPQVSFRPSPGAAAARPLARPPAQEERGDAALAAARTVLAAGGIVAVRGIGGFHLACDAADDRAVQTLRGRKQRSDKPLAVMAADLDTVRRIAQIDEDERALLTSRARPIVLLHARGDSPLSAYIAPGNDYIGVMLPYAPLHHLLFAAPSAAEAVPACLVMTSGNLSDEPIVKDNAEALVRLAPLADAFLLHDRDIHVACDDSVMRAFEGGELPIRRSRGYAPFPVRLPMAVPPTLAVGGELKATFCLAYGEHAFMSQHIGDLENLETLEALRHTVAHFERIFRIRPERIVGDLHPGYLSARWAAEYAGRRPFVAVQHHHAHVTSLMAERGVADGEQILGFSFDGTGYGTDGAIWGGELLLANYDGFRRLAHLRYVPLPGGDAAVRRPYRSALAHLWAAGAGWDERLPCVAACSAVEQGVLRRQMETGFGVVPTSSMGRLFDAVAALTGVRQQVTYEAQAAIELESRSREESADGYAFALHEGDPLQFDAAPLIKAVAADVVAGIPPPRISARFHAGVAQLIHDLALRFAAETGVRRVGLTGGVFQNSTLLRLASRRLRAAGFEVLVHRQVPPNDGGLALGQAVIGWAGEIGR